MKKSKILTGTLAFALMGMMITPLNTFAATGSGNTEVSYENDGRIPDPENPTNPKWSAQIPVAIAFTNTQKVVAADVKLESIGTNPLPTAAEMKINVTVTSKNNYFLTASGADKDPMGYSLVYGGKTMSQTITTVGDLVTTNEIKGTATLNPAAVAKVSGSHTDLLTYTLETETVAVAP